MVSLCQIQYSVIHLHNNKMDLYKIEYNFGAEKIALAYNFLKILT